MAAVSVFERARDYFGRLRAHVRLRARRDAGGARVSLVLRGRPFAAPDAAAADGGPPPTLPERLVGTKLNVGGGKGHPPVPGWQIVDLRESTADVVLDISKEPLPFDDDSVAAIFCSHTLEHIPRDRLAFVLSEFHRVLRPGDGLLRVLVPDIDRAIRAYQERDYAFFAASEVTQADPDAPLGGLLASWFYSTRPDERHGGGHVHCFDYEYMAEWLRDAGFSRIWRSSYRGSVVAELRGDAFDRHPGDSLCVEAVK
jgi:SAM-dependent methyltransferase